MALIDDITITVKAGNGGDGGRSFKTDYGSTRKYSNGGNGGRGGNIYFEGSANINDLGEFRFKKVIEAPDGARGMNNDLDGRKGEDVIVLVPLGTTITNTQNNESVEIIEEKNPILLAAGGRGQAGNHDGRTSVPRYYRPPIDTQPGEKKELNLVLNLIADIGLVGLPNAGKSSLLTTLTAATPKIGNYPFTTLEPNLGVMSDKKNKHVLADIPGLVEGASGGRGLGIKFLKHIQKTKVLLHCIDAAQNNPFGTYETVRNEFKSYDASLLDKEEIILLTKVDLVQPEIIKKHLAELKKTKRKILTISIYNEESISNLKKTLFKAL